MKKYIYINPVVEQSYKKAELEDTLERIGLERIYPKGKHSEIVLEKYKDLLKKSEKVVLDQRCPLIEKYFIEKNKNVVYHNIEPILIHIARELSLRSEWIEGEKYITTPCSALSDFGNRLSLKNTVFMTWDTFYETFHFGEKTILDSLIPGVNALKEGL